MSFRVYIARTAVTRTPEGDFVSDAKVDKNLPDARSWDELREYLYRTGATDGAVKAGCEVWRCYRTVQQRVGEANA